MERFLFNLPHGIVQMQEKGAPHGSTLNFQSLSKSLKNKISPFRAQNRKEITQNNQPPKSGHGFEVDFTRPGYMVYVVFKCLFLTIV